MTQQLEEAVALDQSGNVAAAIAGYEKVLAREPRNIDALFLLGRAYCRMGQLERGAEFLRQAASVAPQHKQAHYLLGVALSQLGRPQEALASFERAVVADPSNVMAIVNKGDALAALGRPSDAIAQFDKALTLDPRNVAAWCNRGNALQTLGRDAEAVDSFGKALMFEPRLVAGYFNLANSLVRLGRHEEAVERYRRTLALQPAVTEAYVSLANSLLALKRWREALECSEQAIKLRPNDVWAHYYRGQALQGLERHEQSLASFNAALAIDADHTPSLIEKASLSHILGRFDETRAAAEKLNKINPRNVYNFLLLADTKSFTRDDPQIAAMEELLKEDEAMSARDRMALHFALGTIYEKLGVHERSFGHFLDGNALRRRETNYDEGATLGMLARIPEIFTPAFLAGKSGHGDPSHKPIFIVGMPRSGTTLIEQILAGHPRVHSCGEIPHFALSLFALRGMNYPDNVAAMAPEEIGKLGAAYLQKATASMPATADRFTDKMLTNLLYVGLIHLALPNARIIYVKRDPVDTCLSCFTQMFVDGHHYANDLGEVGRYCVACEQLAAHWRSVLPADAMLDVQYEDVVADTETQARRIVSYCGLDWDEACLAFHKVERAVRTASATQVRQPIYGSSVGRWQAYRDQLQPLLQALGRTA